MTKRIIRHLGLSLIFAFITLSTSFILSLTSIGWHFLTIIYLLILAEQIFYYRLTAYTTFGLTVLSFIMNFIFWVIELVKFSDLLHDTYSNDNYRILPIALGGLLWGINKLTIDKIFKLLKINFKSKNKLDELGFSTKNGKLNNN
jgi:hypothetical protein